MKKYILLAALLLAIQFVHAQAGTLDSSFGIGGRMLASFGQSSECTAMIMLKSGKILTSGITGPFDRERIGLMRFNIDGTLDSSFANNGQLIDYTFPNDMILCRGIAETSDGKIVALAEERGGVNVHGMNVMLARYFEDGSTDSSFGKYGFIRTDVGYDENCSAVKIDGDGKIIIAGIEIEFKGTSSQNILLMRYNQNGSVDSSFGNNGIVIPDINGAHTFEDANTILLQPDGKIITGGRIFDKQYDSSKFLLMRFLQNGKIDSTFGINGTMVSHFKEADVIFSIALRADGKIIAAGSTFEKRNQPYLAYSNTAIAQYLPNGQPDVTFGKKGKAVLSIPDYNTEGKSILIQNDGKFVIAGITGKPIFGGSQFIVTRFLKNGTVDSSFGIDGSTQTRFGSGGGVCKNAILQSDGKILVSGTYYPGSTPSSFALARYNIDNTTITGNRGKSNFYKNKSTLNNIKLYPNPASNILHIEGLPTNTKTKLTISDFNGNVRMAIAANTATFAWNISRLQKGIYVLRVESGDNVSSTIFIKE
jgi:uncharacterized delta-60 repeat protein